MIWQSIETAPRDGTWILGVMEGTHPRTGVPFYPAVVHYIEDIGWSEKESEEDETCWHLTHWMPLPPPPANDPTTA